MSTLEIIFWVLMGVGLFGLFAWVIYTQGKEAGCQNHEFRIYKVICVHCGRDEERFDKKVVETKAKNASSPPY